MTRPQPLTLIPGTQRLQGRIVRFCTALRESADALAEAEDIAYADPFDPIDLTRIECGTPDDPDRFLQMFTVPHEHDHPSHGVERVFNVVTIETGDGAVSFRACPKDTPIAGTSPISLIRDLAEILRPLPMRAFRILNEDFGGSADWNANHPFIQLVSTAYDHHQPFTSRMDRSDRSLITSLGIPRARGNDWFYDRNADHRGMVAQTGFDTPISDPSLHPEDVARLGNYAIVHEYGPKSGVGLTPRDLVNCNHSDTSPTEQMHHLGLLHQFADSVSPPPPTPIRRIGRR